VIQDLPVQVKMVGHHSSCAEPFLDGCPARCAVQIGAQWQEGIQRLWTFARRRG